MTIPGSGREGIDREDEVATREVVVDMAGYGNGGSPRSHHAWRERFRRVPADRVYSWRRPAVSSSRAADVATNVQDHRCERDQVLATTAVSTCYVADTGTIPCY